MPICEIVPQLFIGDIKGAEDLNNLRIKGVTHVLQAMGGMDPVYPKDFTYKIIDVMDTPQENIGKHLDSVVKWMSSAVDKGGKVFVHCWAGVSRSSACCVAFLMYKLGLTYDSAMLSIRRVRPQAYPNPGFQVQLKEFEKKLKGDRYKQNQQARYLDDYTSIAQRAKKINSVLDSPAGIRSDLHQFNNSMARDRLGGNGLVNKCPSPEKLATTAERIQAYLPKKASLYNEHYTKPWIHNDNDKPHAYFSKTFSNTFDRSPIMDRTSQSFFAGDSKNEFGSYRRNAGRTNAGAFNPRNYPSLDAADSPLRRTRYDYERTLSQNPGETRYLKMDPYSTAYGRAAAGNVTYNVGQRPSNLAPQSKSLMRELHTNDRQAGLSVTNFEDKLRKAEMALSKLKTTYKGNYNSSGRTQSQVPAMHQYGRTFGGY